MIQICTQMYINAIGIILYARATLTKSPLGHVFFFRYIQLRHSHMFGCRRHTERENAAHNLHSKCFRAK